MTLLSPLIPSVIIPVHHFDAVFFRCLAALQTLNPPASQIIIVADGTDIPEVLKQQQMLQILSTPTQSGPAAARNLGAQQATGDLLVFFDADVLVPPDILQQFQVVFAQHPEIDAVIGSYDDKPGDAGFFSQYKNLFHHYTHQNANQEAATFWGACGAIRKTAFLQIGGFDESFRQPSIEDIELGVRLTLQGGRILLRKEIQVKHLKRWTLRSMTRVDIFQRALPWTQLILRQRSMQNDLNLRTASRWSTLLVYLLTGSLLLSPVVPIALIVAALSMTSLLLLNIPVQRFFYQKRGPLFALISIPVLWWYYFYSGLAFVIGVLQFYWNRQKAASVLFRKSP